MKLLVLYFGDGPVYIEGFSKECERSCKGALHLLPKKNTSITKDEYEHIKKCYKHILPKLKVMAQS